MESGIYSLKHRAALEEKRQQFLEMPEPGNLAGEVSLMRALLQEYLERFPTSVNPSEKTLINILEMVERIGRMVERIAKIESMTALTQAEVQLLQAQFADIIVRYVDAERRPQLIQELETSAILERGQRARRPEHVTLDA